MPRVPSLARIAATAAASLALVALGWTASELLHRRGLRSAERRVRLGGYRLVSPLLDVELPEGWAVDDEPIPFKHKVEALVEERVRSGRVRDVAVYYRDLLDGPWFGIHETRRFHPASMMKVPVLVAWLKRAEKEPGVLLHTFAFDERAFPAQPQLTAPERTLADGSRYTVEQLLQFMVAFSDNRAMWLLFNALGPEEVNDVLDSMDVANEAAESGNLISAHGYSGFFRILFNAAYLDRRTSEAALGLLTLQRFSRGIAAGVPRGVTVAAKFGEWAPGGASGAIELHEFGIVYHPRGPYILGVMTEGRDWEAQAGVIQGISALVYGELEHQERGAGR